MASVTPSSVLAQNLDCLLALTGLLHHHRKSMNIKELRI